MPRRVLSDRVDDIDRTLVEMTERLRHLGEDLRLMRQRMDTLEERTHRTEIDSLAAMHRLEREIALIQQQMMEQRSNEARRGERRHTFQHDLFLALVNAILAAIVALVVARS